MTPRWTVAKQGTTEWLRERIGCLTASRMADAMAFSAKGIPLEARRKYMIELIAERMTDTMASRFVNSAMEWGIITEPAAKDTYEQITGQFIENCGFAFHDLIEYCGASPDGLLGHDGLIEIKCPNTETHLKWVLDGVVPDQHKPQMLLQLAVTQRKWCDFMSYDPRLPEPTSIFIKRFEPTAEEITAVEIHAANFLEELELMFDKITQA